MSISMPEPGINWGAAGYLAVWQPSGRPLLPCLALLLVLKELSSIHLKEVGEHRSNAQLQHSPSYIGDPLHHNRVMEKLNFLLHGTSKHLPLAIHNKTSRKNKAVRHIKRILSRELPLELREVVSSYSGRKKLVLAYRYFPKKGQSNMKRSTFH